ncbi:E3 ubiquitin-protein ligase Bre1-like [Amphibalanus amphitrite]|uniref:E3 ubiquitin-protein ligase Bre1-like n=1 Tax=Amphibalanus amphitrite TaxID=1232801 RepID=UPI001C8FE320|nr:E3 ubiquitin-protein ligase Bre1-like [Amphibalanus amphitrite]XP_043237648.1 E3 ubiquitin-protein ligase Bre1-like [Amphibalanus amphitrite]XP_043237650.1 E3 ubiquitin-protein ligase Bre1-like [Amphibalanus amphitrite]
MAKRGADEGVGGEPPPKKVQFEQIKIGPVSTLEEIDMKTLHFQNKKLAERLKRHHRADQELRGRIDQLEKRQIQDDAVLNIINRYWNQLNEDMRVLLQRFDAETSDEFESKNESEATTSFLTQLSTWDKQELDEKLARRVQVSKRAVAKILQAFDRVVQRNEKITLALKGEAAAENEDPPNLDEEIREMNLTLQKENASLHALNTALHEKHHTMSLKTAELQERLTALQTEKDELGNRHDDLLYEWEKTRNYNEKLETHLAEASEKLKYFEQQVEDLRPDDAQKSSGLGSSRKPEKSYKVTGSVQKMIEEINLDLEEQRELATKRLQELEDLHRKHKDVLKEAEKLKMDLRQLPESVIVETPEYKCLQSQFSVLYNEWRQLRTQLEEAKQQQQSCTSAHLRQIEQMESEELLSQRKLRTKEIQQEDELARVRKEYEMLRIEFEQNLAANEQTGPINREMRHLITSLQNHNQQLKGEVQRYRRKYKETNIELIKVRREVEELNQEKYRRTSERQDSTSSDRDVKEEHPQQAHDATVKEEADVKKEDGDGEQGGSQSAEASGSGDTEDTKKDIKKETCTPIKKEQHKHRELSKQEQDMIRDLKSQLKKALNDQKEMKLLLDMYKGVGKEQRDKVQLMAADKKARQECDDLRMQLKRFQEAKREERKKLADEDAIRKIRLLEEHNHTLQKQIHNQKQEAEALLSEMEVTGQAFEDMQDQNIRLIQQLREKDDANFKLMSERIKANQTHKLVLEEKDMMSERVKTLTTQVEAQNQVVRSLEEMERHMQSDLANVKKELGFRQQAMEMHKRKAIESAQAAADLKLHLEKYHAQMTEAQQVVAEKTSSMEQETFKTRRLQEELAALRRKLERAKKIELAGAADDVLMEEVREYKEQLTCPSCKVKRKDAVLTKCFHVFCFSCLRTRYETRQRKCPKCNAAFGANDYHRLYLA